MNPRGPSYSPTKSAALLDLAALAACWPDTEPMDAASSAMASDVVRSLTHPPCTQWPSQAHDPPSSRIAQVRGFSAHATAIAFGISSAYCWLPALPPELGRRQAMAKTGFGEHDLSAYALVADRITLFYQRYPAGRIVTELFSRTEREITFRALVFRGPADAEPAATGWASEREGDGETNQEACLEHTETSAVGRPLATR